MLAREVQRRRTVDAAYFIGRGKAERLAEDCKRMGANLIIVDNDLTPVQQRNLENLMGLKVIDRTQLVLDIFARRARSREGRLQVELAQLNYLLPRLTGRGESLSRLGGGIGTRGPGETKLETDRRRIKLRIRTLKSEIDSIRKTRKVQRRMREETGIPVVAIVGYTNAGKSTLFNAITEASVLVEDRLFATLDPTVRRVVLKDGFEFLLSDTVGFIRNLPHELVEAFAATLEEVVEADLLVHVVDASRPDWKETEEVVLNVLARIGVQGRPVITVLNKIDLLEYSASNPARRPDTTDRPTVYVSAAKRTGLEELIGEVRRLLIPHTQRVRLLVPYQLPGVIALLKKRGAVINERYGRDGVELEADVDYELLRHVKGLIAKHWPEGENPARSGREKREMRQRAGM